MGITVKNKTQEKDPTVGLEHTNIGDVVDIVMSDNLAIENSNRYLVLSHEQAYTLGGGLHSSGNGRKCTYLWDLKKKCVVYYESNLRIGVLVISSESELIYS